MYLYVLSFRELRRFAQFCHFKRSRIARLWQLGEVEKPRFCLLPTESNLVGQKPTAGPDSLVAEPAAISFFKPAD
jgi:hypothetical protein